MYTHRTQRYQGTSYLHHESLHSNPPSILSGVELCLLFARQASPPEALLFSSWIRRDQLTQQLAIDRLIT